MKNQIERIRADIQKHFDIQGRIGWSNEFSQSESGLYYFETEFFKQAGTQRNWIVSKIHVRHIEQQGYIFEYLTDNDDEFSGWVCKDNKEYLILPEAQGGQSILDLSEKKLVSFYSDEDPFIWTNVFISPGKDKLAVEGCYWACPLELVVYDCKNLMDLPYASIHRQVLSDNIRMNQWVDNNIIELIDDSTKNATRINL